MFLLDTVVLSDLNKRRRDPNVFAWLKSVAVSDLYLSVVTIGEVEIGIEQQRSANPHFADELTHWLNAVLTSYSERILPMTLPVARRWGRLAARTGNKGLDLAIAATALEHGLTVATRNLTDFIPTGVATINPFAPRPH